MPLPRIARRSVRVASLLLAAIVGISTGMAAGAEPAEAGFYDVANDELAGQPGTLIRQERMGGAPQGASAYRVLYRSTGLKGEPIAVSGVVVVPDGPPPAQGRPIVAWAHPTTGIVPHCAPSLAFFVFQQMQGLRDMVARGYIVTATDYPGLGTAGPHPYLVGQSEGRAVLDSVRAARNLAAMSASNRFAVWGHSQGGQAALYAGQLAKDYAPELNLVGVAAAAPATDLGALMRDDLPTPGGKNLLAMTLWSWARVYDAPIDQVVSASALPTVNQLSEGLWRIADRHACQAPCVSRSAAEVPVGRQSDGQGTLEILARQQHHRHAAVLDPPLSGAGHRGRHGHPLGHARLHAAPVQGR